MSLENSTFKINSKIFDKQIEIPSSKSYANRALILGALIGQHFKVKNLSSSTDVENLISALKKIGLQINQNGNEVTFINSFPLCEKESSEPIKLFTGDGGTTNRFLLALLALGKNAYQLIPTEKMHERPIADLLNPLKQLGVRIQDDKMDCWIEVQGPIKIDDKFELTINCEKSTQFASALKLALLNFPIAIKYENLHASEIYLKMTEQVLLDVKVKKELIVPVDFSSLSYPVALALADKSNAVLIKNCYAVDSLQADAIFIELIKEIGGDIHFTDEGLKVSGQNNLRPFSVDCNKCPDLIMTLAFLASKIAGTSTLSNLKILQYKESDRLQGVLKLLEQFKINYTFNEKNYSLEIKGETTCAKNTNKIITERDHRMVMMAYLFLRTHGGGELANVDCIEKSFPQFIEIMD